MGAETAQLEYGARQQPHRLPKHRKIITGMIKACKILYGLHFQSSPCAGSPLFRLSLAQRAWLGLYILWRTSVMLSTVALRCWIPHPLAWPLPQELLVILMYGLLDGGRVPAWRQFFTSAAKAQAGVKSVELREVQTGSCRSWWITLAPHLSPQQPRRTVYWLYLHGGAFVAGHPLMYAEVTAYWLEQLARRGIEVKMLSVDYPLAPEHPFPAGLHAAAEAYQWLQQHCEQEETGGPADIIVGGDSAGANLLLGGLCQLRDAGQLASPPHAALLISPAVDMSHSSVFFQVHKEGSGSVEEAVASGYFDYIPRRSIMKGLRLYLPDPSVTTDDPRVSPTHLPDFTGIVGEEGMLVVAGQAEVMRPDIAAFAKKVSAAGVRVSYHEERHEPHCYACLALPVLPHLKAKSKVLVDFVEQVVDGISSRNLGSGSSSSSSSSGGCGAGTGSGSSTLSSDSRSTGGSSSPSECSLNSRRSSVSE